MTNVDRTGQGRAGQDRQYTDITASPSDSQSLGAAGDHGAPLSKPARCQPCRDRLYASPVSVCTNVAAAPSISVCMSNWPNAIDDDQYL